MRLSRTLKLTCGVWLALAGQTAFAQYRGGNCCPAPCYSPTQPAAPAAPSTPDQPPKIDPAQPPMVQPDFAPEQAAAGGGENYAMNMIGDFIGGRVRPNTFTSQSQAPLSSYSLKCGVDQNVLPQNRVYLNSNFYDNLWPQTLVPGSTPSDAMTHVFGMEQTFMSGNVSVGVRLPINQLQGEFNSTAFGDLSIILKALLLDNGSSAVSAGLGVSFPTGPDYFAGFITDPHDPANPSFHTTVLQPWAGAVTGSGDFFVQGFTALTIPLDSELPSIWFIDVGAGYYLLRNGGGSMSALAGILELHANIPLKQDSFDATPVGIPDWMVLVEGVTARFGQATVTVGLGQPVTGPKPYEIEGILQLNLFY